MFEGQLTAVGLFSEAYLHTVCAAGRAAPRSPPGELRQHRHRRGGTGQRAGCRAGGHIGQLPRHRGGRSQTARPMARVTFLVRANRDSLILSIHFNQNEDERSSSQCSHGESHHDFAFL